MMNNHYKQCTAFIAAVAKKCILASALCMAAAGYVSAQTTEEVEYAGTIVDENNEPIPGVAVAVKGTTNGVPTDVSGNFKIRAPKGSILTISYIGYKPMEIAAESVASAAIKLSPEVRELDQVVVVGYGTQKKLDVTGSISSVKRDEIVNQATQNPISALQGRVAGVNIINSGSPGTSPQVRIRGVGSAQGGVDPLYVVDGVFVTDISFINPNDIESVQVLKDASSAAIYGIRAANGVILITTKKGDKGKPTINYNGFAGIQMVTNRVEMATAKKYAQLINEKIGTPTFGEYPSTDWYAQVLRNVAFVQNHQLSINGGSEASTYNFTMGYLNQDGMVKNNNYERLTTRFQNEIQANKNIKVGYNAMYTYSSSNDVPGDIFYQAYVAPPIIPAHEADGSYGDSKNYNTGNYANPLASLDWFYQKTKGHNFVGNAYAEVKFLRDFTFKSSFGFNLIDNSTVYYKSKDSLTSVQYARHSLLTKSDSKTLNWQQENTLTYNKTLGLHRFTALAGFSAYSSKFEYLLGSIQDVPLETESSLYFSLGTASTASLTNTGDKYTIMSFFGRLNYAFNDKYLLTATLRRDGSSKFPTDNRFGVFPSVGLGWVISNENFMKNIRFFDLLKAKASWGRLGNSNIPSNITTQTVNYASQYVSFFGGTSQTGASITTVIPPTLLWEVVDQTDVGLEMEFLKSRLTVETDFYIRNTNNAVFSVPILGTQGTSDNSMLGNFASFQNKGLEFSARWRDGKKDFKYNVGLNLTYNSNKITNVATGDVPAYGGSLAVGGYYATIAKVGQPIGSYYGYVVDGIFQNQTEVSTSAQPDAKPGDFKYKDMNGDGVIDEKDKTILGNPNPALTYGITSGFSYKNFDLQVDIQGVAGVDVYNANKGIRVGNENYTDDFYQNRWHGAGTSNTYPSANLTGTNLDPNSWYVEKGDYIRLRTVQVGYSFAGTTLEKWKIKKLRVYANAQNALNFFTYKGFSPEIPSRVSSTTNSGDPMSSGIDYNVYPLYATYNLGVNFIF